MYNTLQDPTDAAWPWPQLHFWYPHCIFHVSITLLLKSLPSAHPPAPTAKQKVIMPLLFQPQTLWNHAPRSIRFAESLDCFKQLLKTRLHPFLHFGSFFVWACLWLCCVVYYDVFFIHLHCMCVFVWVWSTLQLWFKAYYVNKALLTYFNRLV